MFRFDSLPFFPRLLQQGCEAFLVSYFEGTLQDILGIEAIRTLPSFRLGPSFRGSYSINVDANALAIAGGWK